ncbi:MAG TPA: oligosaccharide flippase family protein [Solirubrobacterales bacterium]|nr:oligosaccharide flippase family protein [Solirubrobacterales bacterium]
MLFKNTLAQSGSMLLGYLLSFLLAPIMISRLGLDTFGVWAVTGAVATYAGLLDLGIGRSLARFVAVFDAEGDDEKIRQCVGLGLLAVTAVGAAASLGAALAAPFLSDSLGVLSTADMRAVVVAAVAIWTLNGYQDVLNVVGLGKRRMVPPNVADAISVSVNFAFSITALMLSTSLVVYAVANAAAALVAVVPAFFAMRHLWASPYAAVPDRALIREVVAFSVKNQVGWIADLVNFQTDKVIIALVVDIRAAAVYEIASRVVMAVRSAAILTVSAIIPTAAARIVEEGREVIGEMYRRYLLRSCAIAFPLFMLASLTAPFLLVAWLGDAPGDSELLVPFLTLAYMANITTGAGSTIAIAAGHPGMVSLNSILIAALNVAFTLALAPFFGVWGVVGGTFLALLVGSLRFSERFLSRFGLPARDFAAGAAPTALLAVGLALPFALPAVLIGDPAGRLPAAALLGLTALGYGLVYWLAASRLDYLPEQLRFPRLRRAASTGAAP